VCPQEAPGLVETYRLYKERGVTFVSITPDAREEAEQFVRRFGVEWPCFYDTPRSTLKALGAIAPLSQRVAPTVYVLRRDGTVEWDDHAARYSHQDLGRSIQALQQAIDHALAVRG
jgi:peroxiredoxin